MRNRGVVPEKCCDAGHGGELGVAIRCDLVDLGRWEGGFSWMLSVP